MSQASSSMSTASASGSSTAQPLPSPMSYPSERVILSHRQPVPSGWTDQGLNKVHSDGVKSISDERIDVVVFLKQQNLAELQKKLDEVSNPKSQQYGNYMSKEDVGAMVNPPIHRQQAVLDWLNSAADVLDAGIQPLGDSIKINHARIEGLKKLFDTGDFHLFVNAEKHQQVYICDQVSVPSTLADVISMVHPLTQFPIAHGRLPHPRSDPHKGHAGGVSTGQHGLHPAHAGHIGVQQQQQRDGSATTQADVDKVSDAGALGDLNKPSPFMTLRTPEEMNNIAQGIGNTQRQ